MIRKVYEVDPLTCSQCGGQMRVIAFITDFSVVDRVINRLKLTFVAAKPPPPHIAYQELLMAAETSAAENQILMFFSRELAEQIIICWMLPCPIFKDDKS